MFYYHKEPSKQVNTADWEGHIYYLGKENSNDCPGVKWTPRHIQGMSITVAAKEVCHCVINAIMQ